MFCNATFSYLLQSITHSVLKDFLILVHCELYLCNINRQDIPEEVHLIWISKST